MYNINDLDIFLSSCPPFLHLSEVTFGFSHIKYSVDESPGSVNPNVVVMQGQLRRSVRLMASTISRTARGL